MDIFVQSASQISMQEPLSEQWFSDPHWPVAAFSNSIEPDYRAFVAPMEARRMGKLQKRAVATALHALQQADCAMPDAVICGTGGGCLENTGKFLGAMLENGESCLPPTPFMQSTHNTIAAQVALKLHCHGYNATYAHGGTSFESALLDATMQFQLHQIHSALVAAHDEMTPNYFKMLQNLGYWRSDPVAQNALHMPARGTVAGNASCSFVLADKLSENTLCRLQGLELLSYPTSTTLNAALQQLLQSAQLTVNELDAVVVGMNGDTENDAFYVRFLADSGLQKMPLLGYKHLFGDSFSASAFGFYVAAVCLKNGRIPQHLFWYETKMKELLHLKNILIINHFHHIESALILLSVC